MLEINLIEGLENQFNKCSTKEDAILFIHLRIFKIINDLLESYSLHPEIKKWKVKKIFVHKEFANPGLTISNETDGWELHIDNKIERDTAIITCDLIQKRELKIDEVLGDSRSIYMKEFKFTIEGATINNLFI